MFKFSPHVLFAASLTVATVQSLSAQEGASGEVFGGYTYIKASPLVAAPKTSMHGWMGGAGAYVNRWFGVGMEIAAQFGEIPPPSGVSAPNLSSKEYSYLVGPQFRFLKTDRVQVAAKFLLGGVFGQVRVDARVVHTIGVAGDTETICVAGVEFVGEGAEQRAAIERLIAASAS